MTATRAPRTAPVPEPPAAAILRATTSGYGARHATERERLWYSPACLGHPKESLFDEEVA